MFVHHLPCRIRNHPPLVIVVGNNHAVGLICNHSRSLLLTAGVRGAVNPQKVKGKEAPRIQQFTTLPKRGLKPTLSVDFSPSVSVGSMKFYKHSFFYLVHPLGRTDIHVTIPFLLAKGQARTRNPWITNLVL